MELSHKNRVFIKVMTSGLDSTKCQVVRLTAIKFSSEGGEWKREVFDEMVSFRQGSLWEKRAVAWNGITEADLQGQKLASSSEVLEKFLTFSGLDKQKVYIFAYNAEFEFAFMSAMGTNERREHIIKNSIITPVREMWTGLARGLGLKAFSYDDAVKQFGCADLDRKNTLAVCHATYLMWSQMCKAMGAAWSVADTDYLQLLSKEEFRSMPAPKPEKITEVAEFPF